MNLPLCFIKSKISAVISYLPEDYLDLHASFCWQTFCTFHLPTLPQTNTCFDNHCIKLTFWYNGHTRLQVAFKSTSSYLTHQQSHRLITSISCSIDPVNYAKGASTKYWLHTLCSTRTYFTIGQHFCIKKTYFIDLTQCSVFSRIFGFH